MTNPTGKGGFQKGQSGNPGGRPKLPADIREAFKAKAPEALEVLTRCLQSDDDRIAMWLLKPFSTAAMASRCNRSMPNQ